jgi:transcription termination factor Rho
VTDTIEPTSSAASSEPKKRSGGLNGMLIADLKAMAGGLGIAGSGSMKKAELVSAIKAAQSGGRPQRDEPRQAAPEQQAPRTERAPGQPDQQQSDQRAEKTSDQPGGQKSDQQQSKKDRSQDRQPKKQKQKQQQPEKQQDKQSEKQQQDKQQSEKQQQDKQQPDKQHQDKQQSDKQHQDKQPQNDEQGSSRSRRRRGRDRNRATTTGGRGEPDTTVLEDDVLVPAAGILDVLDNYAFVRTSGYLAGSDDVYLSLSMVRKYGLRRGDALVGQVRQPREGERREKFNPMVRIDSVNGADPDTARNRVEFAKLTPLYPTERLRLETTPDNLIGRVIDIAAPIGKGQRGLIVSPAKAGKTMVMQSIANSITTNNPECHLMVVLVDERPEEVTDFERSVKGEVIASTFDRPAVDHTTVAELAIERAKRLVELGHDVVVLLDGITRLGRAYNLAAPASGRILSGGVDSAALYPPKKFFGAARNIENGGSLTILATALIESGSKMDEVIFEEFKGTGNMEIRLRREFADKRLFPAIDAVSSGTRREELLMSKEEMAIVWKLRRVLSSLDGQQALELLLERLRKSQTNIEFLMQVQKTTPSPDGKD